MNKPETKFYQSLKSHRPKPPGPWWDMIRLESSTMAGIPDLSVVSYRFLEDKKTLISQEFWVELKAQAAAHPRIRPSQFQWLLRRTMLGRDCWLMNQHPETKEIKMWHFHEKIQAERKSQDRIAILDLPNYRFDNVQELISQDPTRFTK